MAAIDTYQSLRKVFLIVLFWIPALYIGAQDVPTPDRLWGKLFEEVQLNKIFPDNKTFVDATPKYEPSVILSKYSQHRNDADFDLKKFVTENFDLPVTPTVHVKEGLPLKDHLEQLWDILTRKADKKQPYTSLLPLPGPYIVPGGRFREVYYWDSYFTMQGLAVSNRYDLITDMLDNFKWLIDHYGHIPNGNRNYYLSRSQPPYYALMVQLLAEKKGGAIYRKYFSAMEKEYKWWMNGEGKLNAPGTYEHVVKLNDGTILNRYKDARNSPRQESYVQDINTAKEYKNPDTLAYSNLRSAAESGWDFSSRWFADTIHLNTIETTAIIPVDLNCLLYQYELILAKAAKAKGSASKEKQYLVRAKKRKEAIQKYFWNKELNYFFDYDLNDKHTTNRWSLAGAMPLFTNTATKEQAIKVEQKIKDSFLKAGGVITTIYHTKQQWDAPNGWAPLQWITVKGLMNYNYNDLARVVAERWMLLNERVFTSTGKMLEKYNVENILLESGGGEYPTQDGFGWSNGIYLKFYDLFRKETKTQKLKPKSF
ncbi:MAG: alpha,alpha-trehalase TreA [Flavisolibacter sp.]